MRGDERVTVRYSGRICWRHKMEEIMNLKDDDGRVEFFDYNDSPAYIKHDQFPIRIIDGKEVVVYDLEKFYTESVAIRQAEFERMGGTLPE